MVGQRDEVVTRGAVVRDGADRVLHAVGFVGVAVGLALEAAQAVEVGRERINGEDRRAVIRPLFAVVVYLVIGRAQVLLGPAQDDRVPLLAAEAVACSCSMSNHDCV